jgi:hypothetical protein
MSFPNNLIRGIPNADFLVDDGKTVGTHLFYFNKDARDDGWIEQSVNWEDDDYAVEFTLGQLKADGEIQFKAGAARIPREEIDRLRSRPVISGGLSYERQYLVGNPYHGNLLLRHNISKPTMKMIAASIALAVETVFFQNGD